MCLTFWGDTKPWDLNAGSGLPGGVLRRVCLATSLGLLREGQLARVSRVGFGMECLLTISI